MIGAGCIQRCETVIRHRSGTPVGAISITPQVRGNSNYVGVEIPVRLERGASAQNPQPRFLGEVAGSFAIEREDLATDEESLPVTLHEHIERHFVRYFATYRIDKQRVRPGRPGIFAADAEAR